MTFEWKTKKINIQRYYKVIRRCIILNGYDGTPGSGYREWQNFKQRVKILVVPVSESEKYKDMYKHLKIEKAGTIAWGVSGKDMFIWFVIDSRNPRVFMQNVGPGFHECLHVMYERVIGTTHIKYKYDIYIDGIRQYKRGDMGPAATVVVHDNWYGMRASIRIWFLHSIWVPTVMPYIPVKIIKQTYGI